MGEGTKNRYLFGLLSFFLSVICWVFIFKFLSYKDIPFASFEVISLPLSLVPALFGAISLFRNEKMYMLPIIGIIISVLTANKLYTMAVLSSV